ncbi:hypothetical protein KY330_00180 [Candidatus Woesearchaeota archaeon]|nr:hypothetical protein [Candidatus Woesearchaeota archaeon]
MNPWLKEGDQTKVSKLVLAHVEKLQHTTYELSDMTTARAVSHRTLDYIKSLPSTEETKEFRSIDKILEQGIGDEYDKTIAFRCLMIAQGLPCSFIVTMHKDYFTEDSFRTRPFARVYDSNSALSSFLIDVPKERRYLSEIDIYPYMICDEARDIWHMSATTKDELSDYIQSKAPQIQDKYILTSLLKERRMCNTVLGL